MEEETAEGIEAILGMEVKENRDRKGKEGGDRNQRLLGALEFLTQDAEPSGTTLVDDRNGFNELIRLAMLLTVRNCWPAGARFSFNCYLNWAQLLLQQMEDPPVTILGREEVTQRDLFSMVLYGITLVTLAEELRAADLGLLSLPYADDAAFDGLAQHIVQLTNLLMKRGPDRGYFHVLDYF